MVVADAGTQGQALRRPGVLDVDAHIVVHIDRGVGRRVQHGHRERFAVAILLTDVAVEEAPLPERTEAVLESDLQGVGARHVGERNHRRVRFRRPVLRSLTGAGAGKRRDGVDPGQGVPVRDAAVTGARRTERERREAGRRRDERGVLVCIDDVVVGEVVAGLEQQARPERGCPFDLRDVLGRRALPR